MARFVLVAVLLACIASVVMAGPNGCQFIDGDCKPDPRALPPGPRGPSAQWVALLRGFLACKDRPRASCSGVCTMDPKVGCTLTGPARKAFLGAQAGPFRQCAGLAAGACAANPNCKVGDKGACVIAAPGIINVFGLTTNYPGAIPVLKKCKTMVANPKACDS